MYPSNMDERDPSNMDERDPSNMDKRDCTRILSDGISDSHRYLLNL